MVEDHSDSERGNPLPNSSKVSFICIIPYHGLCYTSCGTLAGTRNSPNGGAGRSSEVERSLMVRWVVRSILHRVDPLSYFSFHPVLHDWCNKGRGMCYLWDGAYKITFAVNRKSSLCGGSGFPFSLSEWSLTIYLTPYNSK